MCATNSACRDNVINELCDAAACAAGGARQLLVGVAVAVTVSIGISHSLDGDVSDGRCLAPAAGRADGKCARQHAPLINWSNALDRVRKRRSRRPERVARDTQPSWLRRPSPSPRRNQCAEDCLTFIDDI